MSHWSIAALSADAWSAVARIAEGEEFDPDKVTPGFEGFFATAAMAALVILLGFVLVRTLRRSAYRHQVREEIAQELAETDASAEGLVDGEGGGSPKPSSDTH